MAKDDWIKKLQDEEELIKRYWEDVKKHIRRDIAYIWTDEVREDFAKIKLESGRIAFIIRKLHSYYRTNPATYKKEIADIKNLIHHLNKIQAKTEWVKQIHMDLDKIISDVEWEIRGVKSSGTGFASTPWLLDSLQEIEKLKPKAQMELTLPADIDHRYFVAKLGEPSRRHEIGGLYCPRNRSIVIVRGYAPFEMGNLDPHTPYLKPRKHDDGKFDDVFFHTHPWTSDDRVFRNPIDSCRPSGTDINSVLSCRTIEEEDGYKRTITSLIGSRGFLSVTEVHGIRLDENLLYQNGLSQEQVLKIKQELSLEPPVWTTNFAKSDEVKAELLDLTRRFYHFRRTDRTKNYHQKVMEFKDAVKELVHQGALDKFIDEIVGHLPNYVSPNYLRNIGLSDNHVKLVQEMTGVEKFVYQLVESSGLKQIE